jgi:hypothetical protein
LVIFTEFLALLLDFLVKNLKKAYLGDYYLLHKTTNMVGKGGLGHFFFNALVLFKVHIRWKILSDVKGCKTALS